MQESLVFQFVVQYGTLQPSLKNIEGKKKKGRGCWGDGAMGWAMVEMNGMKQEGWEGKTKTPSDSHVLLKACFMF